MALLTQSITCPFCFSKFPVDGMLFRCVALACSGRAPDPTYSNARGFGTLPMGHIIPPTKQGFSVMSSIPKVAQCDVCKRETRTRICPECHFELSHDMGQIDQKIIAIIGGSNTGKSHYIATLVNKLQHEVGANYHFGLAMLGDSTRERWNADFYKPLFENKTVLQPTQPGAVDSRVKNPLIFRLTFGQGRTIRAINLSFFDTAGEDMASLGVDTLSIEARYISQADGILVLLDPLQIKTVRQKLFGNESEETKKRYLIPQAHPELIISRLRELLERANNIPANKRVKIPIAFTLSKTDVLDPIVTPDSALKRSSEHFGALDLDDVQSLDTEIGGYLRDWISANFTEEIGLKFANYRYFGISSLGRAPDASNHVDVNSRRVEDPFLWLLHQLNLIKGKKGR